MAENQDNQNANVMPNDFDYGELDIIFNSQDNNDVVQNSETDSDFTDEDLDFLDTNERQEDLGNVSSVDVEEQSNDNEVQASEEIVVIDELLDDTVADNNTASDNQVTVETEECVDEKVEISSENIPLEQVIEQNDETGKVSVVSEEVPASVENLDNNLEDEVEPKEDVVFIPHEDLPTTVATEQILDEDSDIIHIQSSSDESIKDIIKQIENDCQRAEEIEINSADFIEKQIEDTEGIDEAPAVEVAETEDNTLEQNIPTDTAEEFDNTSVSENTETNDNTSENDVETTSAEEFDDIPVADAIEKDDDTSEQDITLVSAEEIPSALETIAMKQIEQNQNDFSIVEAPEDVQTEEENEIPQVLTVRTIDGRRGFYLSENDDKYALFGYVNDEIILLKEFDKLYSKDMGIRFQERTLESEFYLVKANNTRILVSVEDETMNIAMEF